MVAASLTSQKPPSCPSKKQTKKPEVIRKALLVPIKSVERPPDLFLGRYPYLREAQKLRPATYQSPYEQGGGFSLAYLPNPQAPTMSGSSISEDFLMARSSSEQDKIKDHQYQFREFSAQRQRDDILRQQEKLQNQQRQRQYSQAQPIQPFTSNHQSYSAPNSSHSYRPSQQFSAPIQTDNSSAYDLSPPPYIHAQSYLHNSTPLQRPYPTSGLQYQSSQDFQMQMQRESQRDGNGSSFDQFFKGLQNAAAVGHEQAGSYGRVGGGQSSPLQTGMGNGGEMLPMMRDVRF